MFHSWSFFPSLSGRLGQLGLKEKLCMSVQNVAKAINLFGKHGISEGNTFFFIPEILQIFFNPFPIMNVYVFCVQVCRGRCSFRRPTPFMIWRPVTPKKHWRLWHHGEEKSLSQFPQPSPAALRRSAPSVVRYNHKI